MEELPTTMAISLKDNSDEGWRQRSEAMRRSNGGASEKLEAANIFW